MAVNLFRPGSIVDPEYFVGRNNEIERFKSYLKNAKEGNPHNLTILGERGIGKTSLVRYLAHLSKEEKCLVVRIELDPSIKTIDELLKHLLNELKQSGIAYSVIEKTRAKLKGFFDKYDVSVSLFGAGVSVQKTEKAEVKTQFRYRLKEIWDKVKGDVPAIIFMIDEAEQLEAIEGALHYLRNALLRLSEEHCGYMLVLSGKLTLFKEMKELHSPLARFLNPIKLPPLSNEETKEALRKPAAASGINISKEVLEEMAKDSEGHPYIVQMMGFVVCEEAKKNVTGEVYRALRPQIIEQLELHLFEDMYNSASEEEKKILRVLAIAKKPLSLTEFASHLKKEPSYLGTYLTRLGNSHCIRKVKRGSYELFHSLFGEYIRTTDASEAPSR
ncbi:ATP-binding protein [Candidatus Micrarchaeota archaeon]|nr:ATP-binding protein [Candidatus Micrarchaeota archaeon]